MTSKNIKVHNITVVPAHRLIEHAHNSNRQSQHVFDELKANIIEQGFDENLVVRPVDNGQYEVVSGNHRFRAGLEVGMEKFPCVVRDDWDEVESEIQSVRRNYARGRIDRDAFTAQVDSLANEHSLLMGDIMSRMGFENEEAFAAYYQTEKERQEEMAEATMDAPAVRMMDNLGYVISEIYEKYGDTVPNSFLVFPVGGKEHLYVASSSVLKETMEKIVVHCIANDLDINIALAGLISIGMANSDFIKDVAEAKEAGTGDEDADSDFDFDLEE